MFKARRRVHKSLGPVWVVSRPGQIQYYMMPTWKSAIWLACDMARYEDERGCGAM